MFDSWYLDRWNKLSRHSKAAAAGRRRPPTRRAARRTTPLRVEHLERRNLLAAAPADLVSWYRAEGDAADSVGGNDGALENGTTFTAGKVGQAFLFDGFDDQISVPDIDDELEPGSNFTVEAWVNPSESGHGRPIAEKRAGNANSYTFETTHAPYGPNDGLQFVVWIGGVQQNFLQTPAGVLTNGEWQHVAATYDGTALRIFVDGVEKASSSVSGAIDTSTAPTVIGLNSVAAFAWKGAIDEISFYSRALTQAEIQGVVDAGSAGKQTTIVVNTAADTIDADPGVTSLREAILQSNASAGVLDTISFDIPRPSTDGLVSWYRAEGNANDSIDGNHGTLQNGATATGVGRYGQAFDFDGVDDSVDLGNWFDLQTFTIDMWVKPGASQTAYANIIDNNHTDFRGLVIQQNASNLNQYVWGVHDGQTVAPVFDLAAGVWHHVAVTRDGASRVSNVYVNGSLVGSITGTTNIPYDGAEFLRLGRWGGGGRNWNGELDEVGIFDRALSAAEVQAIASRALSAAEIQAIATISPTSALPTITDPVIIDGYTQPGASPNTLADGNDAVILIELDGTNAGEASGLTITGGGSTVRGLAINRFEESGIVLASSDNVVAGNFLGTDVTGTLDRGNGAEGVTIVGAAEIEPFYSNDFESGAGEEWSSGGTDETPADDSKFLGQFGSETVTLTLNADGIDQDITVITVAFDLFVIRTWDGNHSVTGSGPDRFTLSLGDGTTLLDTTFSNSHPDSASAGQAYPGVFGTGQFDSRTSAAENNTLGFTFPGVDVMDSVYRLSFTFPYTGGDLVLNFTGALTSSIDDESWGLNNVKLFAGEVGKAAEGNTIGGTSPDAQNIVAFSGGDGIRTDGENTEVAIIGNSIFANGAQGIDLDDENINPPEILLLTSFPAELKLTGSLDNDPSIKYRIEFYANAPSDPSDFDEGQRLLSVRQVTTDANGHIAFIHELPPVAAGEWITATATRLDGDGETLLHTSEFSAAVQVIATANADLEVTITDSPDPIFVGEPLTYTITVTNHGPVDATGVVVTDVGSPGGVFGSATLPVGDLPNGASRSFQIVIYPGAAGTITNTASVTANEDDPVDTNNTFTASTLVERVPLPKIELAEAQYEVREGEAFAVLTVRRTGNLTQGARVDFTTVDGTAGQRGIRAGLTRIDDFTTTSGTLVFRSRSNLATIRVPIRDDGAIEPDETFQVVLSNPSIGNELGPIASAVVTIHDNDPTVFFVAASMERNESITSRNQIEVKLQPASNQTVTVVYSVVGGTATPTADFTLTGSRTLTFRPGETSKFVNLNVVNDSLFEGNETVILELSSPTNAFLGGQMRHRVTIVDNDPVPPPADPGSTIGTALAIDLATLPRQSYRQFIGKADVDTFKVTLKSLERLALDVDPFALSPGLPGLPNSKLTIRNEAGALLATIGASAEPETGQVTNNAAHLFQAPSGGGTYYIQLTTTGASKAYGYSLGFHRLGVSENVPSPDILNAPGPMYAWYDGDKTVGITGPTGYGFTLVGPWQHEATTFRRTALSSQKLTMPRNSQFVLKSPQGVEMPLIANGEISISTKSQRWGNLFGVVDGDAIKFPVAIDIVPLNNLLASTFGSQFATAGLLGGEWRISLGGRAFNLASGFGRGIEATEIVDQLLPGVPYLRKFEQSVVDAHIGGFRLSQLSQPTPMNWIFDPADPMLYVRIPMGPGVAASKHGLLRFQPDDPPDGSVEAGVTEFAGHIYATATIPLPIPGFPLSIGADLVINVDADRDGKPLGDLGEVGDLVALLAGDPFEVREVLRDIQLGANGRLNVSAPAESPIVQSLLTMELGRASVVLNGLAETVWLRGEFQGRAFAGTPVELAGASVLMEGLIDFGANDFLYIQKVTSNSTGIELGYEFRISNEGVSLRVFGGEEWGVKIDRNGVKVSGKATVSFEALVAIEIDDDGDVHLAGSVSASGKLTARIAGDNTTLFSGSVEAKVRSRGLRFRFPRGVGNLDLDLF